MTPCHLVAILHRSGRSNTLLPSSGCKSKKHSLEQHHVGQVQTAAHDNTVGPRHSKTPNSRGRLIFQLLLNTSFSKHFRLFHESRTYIVFRTHYHRVNWWTNWLTQTSDVHEKYPRLLVIQLAICVQNCQILWTGIA